MSAETKQQFSEFNINSYVYVKLTDKGIEKWVKNHNELLPFNSHISYKEFESRKNENGYHKFQTWDFIDIFGGLGMRSYKYFSTNILFHSDDLNPIN